MAYTGILSTIKNNQSIYSQDWDIVFNSANLEQKVLTKEKKKIRSIDDPFEATCEKDYSCEST